MRPRAARAAAGRELEVDPARARCGCGAAGGAVAEGVRAAARLAAVAYARIHEGGVAAGRLGLPVDGGDADLDSHACRLRQKLGTAGDRFVVNVWGVGYRLVDGPAEAAA